VTGNGPREIRLARAVFVCVSPGVRECIGACVAARGVSPSRSDFARRHSQARSALLRYPLRGHPTHGATATLWCAAAGIAQRRASRSEARVGRSAEFGNAHWQLKGPRHPQKQRRHATFRRRTHCERWHRDSALVRCAVGVSCAARALVTDLPHQRVPPRHAGFQTRESGGASPRASRALAAAPSLGEQGPVRAPQRISEQRRPSPRVSAARSEERRGMYRSAAPAPNPRPHPPRIKTQWPTAPPEARGSGTPCQPPGTRITALIVTSERKRRIACPMLRSESSCAGAMPPSSYVNESGNA
jgi:hypothetical protein